MITTHVNSYEYFNKLTSFSSQLHNHLEYAGDENDLIFSRIYTTEFICKFQLGQYPFDTQLCSMVFVIEVKKTFLQFHVKDSHLKLLYWKITLNTNLKKLPNCLKDIGVTVDLLSGNLNYSGPIDLPQYFVKELTINNKLEERFYGNGFRQGQKIEIVLGRRILNQILTTFMPSSLICLVALSTNFFRVWFLTVVTSLDNRSNFV